MAEIVKQWHVEVDEETDREVRDFLCAKGGGGESLSEFIVEAVCAQIFHLSVARSKAANLGRPPHEIETLVEEAVNWARSR